MKAHYYLAEDAALQGLACAFLLAVLRLSSLDPTWMVAGAFLLGWLARAHIVRSMWK